MQQSRDYSPFLADLAHFSDVVCEEGTVCNDGEVWGLDLSNQHTTVAPRGPEVPIDGGTGEGNSAWAATTCSIVNTRVVDGQLVSDVQFTSVLDIPAEYANAADFEFEAYAHDGGDWGQMFSINMFNPEVTPLAYMWTVFNTALTWSFNGNVVSDTPVNFDARTYVVSDDFKTITATSPVVSFTAPYNGEATANLGFTFNPYLDPANASCSTPLASVEPPVVVPPVVDPPTEVAPPAKDTPVKDEPLAKTGLDLNFALLLALGAGGVIVGGGSLILLSRRAS